MPKMPRTFLCLFALSFSFAIQATQQALTKEEFQQQLAVLQQKLNLMEPAHLQEYRKSYFLGKLPKLKADHQVTNTKYSLGWLRTFEELEVFFRAEYAFEMLDQTKKKHGQNTLIFEKYLLGQKLAQITTIVHKPVTIDPHDNQKSYALQLTRLGYIRLARIFNAWLIHAFTTKTIDDNFSYILDTDNSNTRAVKKAHVEWQFIQKAFPKDPEVLQMQYLINLATAGVTYFQKKQPGPQNFPTLTTLSADAVNYYRYPQLIEQ